ncbi:metalloregulator ArsR/SmtB family transcription factor [Cyanobacteria bacterium FACHB-472]|nr:metalloregulator ArsR/SmtB family transcription factor [Cyanobacteria bacterium FACHB-472]
MKEEEFQTLLCFFKVLANESRLKILGILANRECSVEELAALVKLKEPTVSHHLGKLKELSLVNMRPEGNTHLYQLDSEALQGISKEIFTPENMASLVSDVEGEAWESKVLKNFFEGDRLKEIPASRKKRLVILKWLASQFESGVNYPEIQVNEIIKRYHPDCATLRRELIGYQLMQRENGVYWRLPVASGE